MSTDDSFSWGAESLTRHGGGLGARRVRLARSSARRTSLLGARAVALLADGCVLFVPLFAVAFAFSRAFPHRGFFFSSNANGSAYFGLGLSGLLVVTALSLCYFFLCEALRGQTVGKRSMALHVEAASGGAPGLNQLSGRTVLRLIDALPFLYLIGTLVALVTGARRRRLGDWVGGTVVVRDGVPPEIPARPLWQVLAYPLSWTAAAFVVIFALGVGTAVGSDEQAVSLVRSYEQARQQGNGALACSMLSREQERELVAAQTGEYRAPDLASCPRLILESDPRSHLLNPSLASFVEGPMTARYSSAGVAAVSSRASPGLALVVLFERGQAKLDVRGVEKLEFAKGCKLAGASSGYCGCMWRTLRAEGLLDGLAAHEGGQAVVADARRCHPG